MKKETKKIIAAGIVMMLGCAVCGSVGAANYTEALTGTNYDDDDFNLKTHNVKYPIDTDSISRSIVGKNINITVTSDLEQNLWGADAYTSDLNKKSNLILGNENTEEINVKVSNSYQGMNEKYSPIGLFVFNGRDFEQKKSALGSEMTVTAKKLNVDVSGDNAIGIVVQNNTESSSGKDADTAGAKMTIKADDIQITSSHTGIAAYSNGELDINGDLNVTAGQDAFQVRGFSTTNVNVDGKHKTVLNGDINFGTPNEEGGDGHNSGAKIDATLNINFKGEGSAWNGKAYQEMGQTTSIELSDNPVYYGNATGLTVAFSDGAQWNVTGDSFVNHAIIENGGAINVTDGVAKMNIDTVKMDDGTVNLQGDNQNIKVNQVAGDGTVSTQSLSNKMAIATKAADTNIKVEGSGAIGDQILAGKSSLNDLASVVSNKEGTQSVANAVETEEGEIAGKITAQVGEDGKVITQSIERAVNTSNQAISNMATLSLMTWRQENNDMNKRLGELRASQGQQGVWARMARGQAKYGAQSIKNQYNYYQLGYDSKISDTWTLGGAFTYTDGESSYTNGSGTNKHTGFAIYGSNLRDDGSFIDIIAKYAHMKNDFDVNGGVGKGDYSTNGYSLSAEYGKRFQQDGFWIEPQAELTYGKVSSADFKTANGATVHQDSMDSLVGRLGFSLGKDLSKGNVYVRASYLYDFQGDASITMMKDGAATPFRTDIGGSWWEFGVGTNLNLGKDTHFYLDVETTAGGDVDTPWQWNAGVRFSF